MKNFGDLDKNDYLYSIIIEPLTKKISLKKILVQRVSKNEGMVTVFFDAISSGSTPIIITKKDDSEMQMPYKNKTVYFFSDKLVVEIFLKNKCQEYRDFISSLENIYFSLWKDEEDKKEQKIKLSKGDILRLCLTPKDTPFLCAYDGESSFVFRDGHPINRNFFSKYKIELASKEEIKTFFDNFERELIKANDVTKKDMINSLKSVGYNYNPSEHIFYKL